jgi:hypothetical protein
MKKKPYFYELKGILLSIGKEGSTDYERYVDLPSNIIVNTKWYLCQLCYFADDDQLAAYALNKCNEGKFYDVSNLPKTVREKLIAMIEDTFCRR